MKVSELISMLNGFLTNERVGDVNVEVFAKGEIFPIKEVNFVEKDGVLEINCGWNTIEDEREEEYISEINKRGW